MNRGPLHVLAVLLLIVLLALVAYPFGWLTVGSGVNQGTFGYLVRSETIAIITRTIGLALLSGTVSVVVGSVAAFLVVRTNLVWAGGWRALMLLSYFTPSLFLAFAYVVLVGSNGGLLTRGLAQVGWVAAFDILSPQGFVLLASFEIVPIVFIVAANSFVLLHGELEDVSRISGASRLRTILRVTLPLAFPGIGAGALLGFVSATSLYGVPAVFGVRVISVAIQGAFSFPFRYDRAAALSYVLLAFAFVAVVAYYRALGEQRHLALVGGKWKPPQPIELGRWQLPALALVAIYAFAGVVAPYAVLFTTALSRNWTLGPSPENFTIEHFASALGDDLNRRAITNSLEFALAAGLTGLVLGSLAALVLVRLKGPLPRAIEALLLLAWAFPAISLGAAFLIAFLHPPVLYGSGLILALAYLTKFMPLAVRSVQAGLQHLGPEVEEAARISGAGWVYTARRIILPLLAAPLVAGFILIFAPSFRELSASILLAGPGNETLAVAALLAFESSQFETAAALGAIGALVSFAVWFVLQRYGGTRVISGNV